MQITAIFLAFTAASSAAVLKRAPSDLCPALDTPLCCQLDVDGVVDATCEAPDGSPSTVADFETACADVGSQAQCCTLPLAGDALLCTAP